MSTTTVYPVASSGPDDDVYTARYPHTSDPSGKTLRESGRKILNMAKPKTVPKKYIRTAEGTRPRTRTKVRKEKLAKIRAARESAFMEGGAGSGRRSNLGLSAYGGKEHSTAARGHLKIAETLERHGKKEGADAHYEAAKLHSKASAAHKKAEAASMIDGRVGSRTGAEADDASTKAHQASIKANAYSYLVPR